MIVVGYHTQNNERPKVY